MNDSYKIFRQLQERQKEYQQYASYEKEELIEEILELQQERDKYKSIVEMVKKDISFPGDKFIEMYHMKEKQTPVYFVYEYKQDLKTKIKELEEGETNE